MAIKAPRWGFRIGWEDFIVTVRREAQAYGLTIDDRHFSDGVVPAPEPALFESWDIRPLGSQCRDLDPHEWTPAIRKSLFELYGRSGTVELVDEAPRAARSVPMEVVEPTLRDRLRFQLIPATAATILDPKAHAMRPFADVACVLLDGGHPVSWSAIDDDGLDREQAFLIGLQNAVRDTGPDMQTKQLDSKGALCEVAVANRDYANAVMLAMHSQMEDKLPLVLCPLTMHHWIMATLKPEATRDTLREIGALAVNLRDQFATRDGERIEAALWWWPGGAQIPVPFEPDGALPPALSALVSTPP